MEHPLTLPHQLGPLIVSLAYLLLYYIFMGRVAVTKRRLFKEYRERGEKFDRYFGQDRTMLAIDRSQLNMLEHMPPFLALLWLNAVCVSPGSATIAGGLYVAARAAYPLLVGGRLGRAVRPMILLSTLPGYLVMLYFLGALTWVVVAGG